MVQTGYILTSDLHHRVQLKNTLTVEFPIARIRRKGEESVILVMGVKLNQLIIIEIKEMGT